MYKQNLAKQWFCALSSIKFPHMVDWRKPHLCFLCAASTCLVLAAPTILNLPGSQLLAETPISQNLETASLYQQGVTRYNRGDWQGAESAFRQVLQREPNIAMARHYLGNIFLMQNRLDLATQEYGEAIRLNPNFGDAYYNLGLALHQQGKTAEAIAAYRQALVIDPTKVAANYNLGLVLYEQGLLKEAIAAYQDAVNLDPTQVNIYHNLAIAQQQNGKMAEAIATYQQLLKLDPKNAIAYNNLGSLMAMQGKPAEAIAIYIQAVRQDPKNASAYYNLGITLYNQGEWKKASQAFQRAHQEYRQQGNLEQTTKAEELMQQVAQKIEAEKLQQRQASTAKPIANSTTKLIQELVNAQKKPTNSGDVPISAEQPLFQPVFPDSKPTQVESNGKV